MHCLKYHRVCFSVYFLISLALVKGSGIVIFRSNFPAINNHLIFTLTSTLTWLLLLWNCIFDTKARSRSQVRSKVSHLAFDLTSSASNIAWCDFEKVTQFKRIKILKIFSIWHFLFFLFFIIHPPLELLPVLGPNIWQLLHWNCFI